MVDVPGLVPRRVFLEARFPPRMAFIDHLGELTDEFTDDYPNYEVLPTEVKMMRHDREAELVLAMQRVWVNSPAEDEASGLDAFERATTTLHKYLGVLRVDFVGARQHLLLGRPDVSLATADFRSAFFDYKSGAFTALGGEAVEAQAIAAYRLPDGLCRLLATSVYTGDSRSGDGLAAGAILFDIDRTDDQGKDIWEVVGRAKELLTEGRRRALDFASQLNLVADRPKSEE